MPTLFLICGLPGSGKTTLSKQLEHDQPALRLGEDDWMIRLYASKDGSDEAKRELVKSIQWDVAERALRLGIDVVLDWGFWGRASATTTGPVRQPSAYRSNSVTSTCPATSFGGASKHATRPRLPIPIMLAKACSMSASKCSSRPRPMNCNRRVGD